MIRFARIPALLIMAASLAAPMAVWAHGDVTCSEPRAEWRARVDLQKKLKGAGWAIRDIKIENGCYEVYGFDEKSKRVEAFFNPKTFERIYPGSAAANSAAASSAAANSAAK